MFTKLFAQLSVGKVDAFTDHKQKTGGLQKELNTIRYTRYTRLHSSRENGNANSFPRFDTRICE